MKCWGKRKVYKIKVEIQYEGLAHTGCQAPADYATANTQHHLEWCSLKNLIKGKGRQESFSRREDSDLSTKPILVLES